MSRIIEIASNIAIILVCGMVGVQALRHSSRSVAAQKPAYTRGETIRIPGVDFSAADRTLLLVVRKDCHFCEASMPFYQSLGSIRRQSPGARIVALTSDDVATGTTNFEQHGVQIDQVVTVRFGDLKVSGTPTAILIDRTSVVRAIWSGQLDDATQNEVRRALVSTAG